jgi:hypothetical protein
MIARVILYVIRDAADRRQKTVTTPLQCCVPWSPLRLRPRTASRRATGSSNPPVSTKCSSRTRRVRQLATPRGQTPRRVREPGGLSRGLWATKSWPGSEHTLAIRSFPDSSAAPSNTETKPVSPSSWHTRFPSSVMKAAKVLLMCAAETVIAICTPHSRGQGAPTACSARSAPSSQACPPRKPNRHRRHHHRHRRRPLCFHRGCSRSQACCGLSDHARVDTTSQG